MVARALQLWLAHKRICKLILPELLSLWLSHWANYG
jgi:hypothetical protein